MNEKGISLQNVISLSTLAPTHEIYHPQRPCLSVDERLKSSKNEQAKAVLTAMKDYVLEFENESPV
jgi:hypothetical protein